LDRFDALVPAERRREPLSDVELLDLAVKLSGRTRAGPQPTR
jgi:hypothetical protein